MIRAYEERRRSLDARLRMVTESYERDGLSLSEPFLGPGSVDIYQPVSGTS
jgi:hypothetical protein